MPTQAALTVVNATTITAVWGNAMRDSVVLTCTSGARPSSPHEGMTIVETDTNRMAIYSGSAWVYVSQYASTDWTPTPYRVSAPTQPTYTVNQAKFSYAAGWVQGQTKITITQNATSGYEQRVSASGLPSPLGGAAGAGSCGTFEYSNSGVNYLIGSVAFDGTDFFFRAHLETSQIGIDPTFTPTNGDTINFSFKYPVI